MNVQSVFRTGAIAVIALIFVCGFVYTEVIDTESDGASDMYTTLTVAAMAAVGIGMAAPAAISAVQGTNPSPGQQQQHAQNIDRLQVIEDEIGGMRDLLDEQRFAYRRDQTKFVTKGEPLIVHVGGSEPPSPGALTMLGVDDAAYVRRDGDNI